jgi:hypothetical protein
MTRASKNVYHPNGNADDFRTVEDALDALKPFSGFLQYVVPLSDPNADRILFWDDSATGLSWLQLSGMTISGTTLSVDAATTVSAGIIEHATTSEYRSNTIGNLALMPETVWDAAGFVSLTDAASIAIDMSTGFNFSVAIAGNRTLANPTNAKPGQAGVIRVGASGGSRTIGKGSNYASSDAITWPISIGTGTVYIYYHVFTSSVIIITGVVGPNFN